MIMNWLNSGEALKWYSRDNISNITDVENNYLGISETNKRIVNYKGKDIGIIQWYKIVDYAEYSKAIGGRIGDYGMDLFIGCDALIGQGIGKPKPNNIRAIRCYEKCGFMYSHTCSSDDGEEYIMTMNIVKCA